MIAPAEMPALVERLVVGYRDSGGSPDAAFVVCAATHQSHMGAFTKLLGYPVEVREWVPVNRVLLESLDDLARQDEANAEIGAAVTETLGLDGCES